MLIPETQNAVESGFRSDGDQVAEIVEASAFVRKPLDEVRQLPQRRRNENSDS